jgi:hypothetical protein
MIVNFKAYKINRDICKLTRTPTLIIIIKNVNHDTNKDLIAIIKGI